jgi:hypothetical protein
MVEGLMIHTLSILSNLEKQIWSYWTDIFLNKGWHTSTTIPLLPVETNCLVDTQVKYNNVTTHCHVSLAVTVLRASRATDARRTLMTATTTSVKTMPHVLIWCRHMNVAVLQVSWVSQSSLVRVPMRVYHFMTKSSLFVSLVPLFILFFLCPLFPWYISLFSHTWFFNIVLGF